MDRWFCRADAVPVVQVVASRHQLDLLFYLFKIWVWLREGIIGQWKIWPWCWRLWDVVRITETKSPMTEVRAYDKGI